MPTRRSRFGDLHGSVINYVMLVQKTTAYFSAYPHVVETCLDLRRYVIVNGVLLIG